MRHSLIALIFLLAILTNIAVVQGATYIEPYSPQAGPPDTHGADRIVSFFDLPLWVQVAWIRLRSSGDLWCDNILAGHSGKSKNNFTE